MVNPTMRPGMTEEVCRLLPEGIGLIPLFLNISRGTEDEFETMMPHYEKLIAVLAEQKCDLIHPNGAPPFMVHGFKGEAKIVAGWEKKYKTPIISVAQNHVRALKAVKAKSFVGATYFPDKLNAIFAQIFHRRRLQGARHGRHRRAVQQGAGALRRADLRPHQEELPQDARAPTRSTCSAPAGARCTIIETLEQDLRVPVVHPVTARVWEFQKRLHVREPRSGFGCYVEGLPELSP